MSITAAEFIARLGSIGKELVAHGPEVVQQKAIAGTSLIVERIQAKGVPGATYSTNRLPDWFFSDKELNAGGRAYLSKQDDEKDPAKRGVTWGEFRAAQGLQTAYVDLTYSGRMLGGLVIVDTSAEGTKFTAIIGGSDMEIDDKLRWNAERYGDKVFQPTAAEQKELDFIVLDLLETLLQKYLGNAAGDS